MRLGKNYFLNSAIALAPDLLGKLLCRRLDNEIIKVRITETECYVGTLDSACHASKGKTNRNEVMFREGGRAYVYLCYGIHCLLNVVTGEDSQPEAVLIRGVESASGPGRVTKLLKITREHNKEDFCTSNQIWIEDDGIRPAFETTKRIGIDYAMQADRERLWRFVAVGSKKI